MTVPNFVWPLIAGAVISVIAFGAVFVLGLVPRKQGYRQSFRWAYLLVATFGMAFGYSVLAFQKPAFTRGDGRFVVYGQQAMHWGSHWLFALAISLACYSHARFYLIMPAFAILMQGVMLGGEFLTGFAHWLALILAVVLLAMSLVASFWPDFGLADQSRGKSYVRRVIIRVVWFAFQLLILVFWMLDSAVWNVFGQLATNICFFATDTIFLVFVVLWFILLNPDDDSAIRSGEGPSSSAAATAEEQASGETAEEEEEAAGAEEEASETGSVSVKSHMGGTQATKRATNKTNGAHPPLEA